MGCCTCTSKLLVYVSSIIYTMLGLAITGTAISMMATHVKDIVPTWYSSVILGVGIVILIAGVIGFLAVCRRRETKCWMGIFMVLTLVVFLVFLGFTGVAWKTEEALEAANNQNFVDVSGVEKTAAEGLKSAFTSAWDKCEPEISPTGEPNMYKLECEEDNLDFLEEMVNDACLKDPVTNTTEYYSCYTDASWWAPSDVPATPVSGSIQTEKGLFCQCADEVVDFIKQYYTVGRWVALGLCVFYFCVFLALCYLCCCVKPVEDKLPELNLQGGYFARP